MSGKRVLFVGHDAGRTGAPIMLLHLLRWLRSNSDLDFDLLLCRGGPLTEEYAEICSVFTIPPPPERAALLETLAEKGYGLLYSNTVTNGATLAWLSPLSCPAICHAHEVATFFQTMDDREVAKIKDSAAAFIAVTKETFSNLVRAGVPDQSITLVPGFLPAAGLRARDAERRRQFRREHQIPLDAILVGGCGTAHWQKGPDLFLHVANLVRGCPNSRILHFAWAGAQPQDSATAQLLWDLSRAGLSSSVSILPGLADIAAFFESVDIFALTSRNDPLPLVAMEAGAHGIPVICFEGNAEPVDSESGRVVPYLDLEQFAQAIRELAEDDRLRAKLGERLAGKIRAQHDVSVVAPRIVDIIRTHLRD